jgi:dicarboxylate/amino acid:cation (Na+ or H+) symporter, DAACS family
MFETIRKYLPNITIYSLFAGLLIGILLQDKTSVHTITEPEFLREIERGSHMSIIVTSSDLPSYIADATAIRKAVTENEPLVLRTSSIEIPDSYAASIFDCARNKDLPWFSGQLVAKSEGFIGRGSQLPLAGDGHLAAQFRASGSLYSCEPGTHHKMLLASGISISAPIHPPELLQVTRVSAWASYSSFVAGLYLTFLIMLFIPTLAISLLQAIIETARSASKFRAAFVYFAISTLLGACVGTLTAVVYHKFIAFNTSSAELEILGRSLGGATIGAEYDPHPVLTQLGKIIPTNPLGALTDPTGNNGLQVAFMALVLGMVLAALGQERRERISSYLKSALALVISDRDLKWRALSDYADWLAPVGVFFFTVTAFSTANFSLLHDLAHLAIVIAVALAVHVAITIAWLAIFRDLRGWVRDALRPGSPGLVTAFATASSYAALPAVDAVPLLESDAAKKAIVNLGTTLNKAGTSVYLSASATFIFLQYPGLSWQRLVGIVVTSALAGVVIAGLPFAAIVGLRMTLIAVNLPGELAWLILPIDPVSDRLVTPVNVFSNLASCSDPKRPRTKPAATSLDPLRRIELQQNAAESGKAAS